MKSALIDVNVWSVLMAPCVNITSMTVCPTLVTTTHCAKMASIITLVLVSQVSLTTKINITVFIWGCSQELAASLVFLG